MIDFKCYGFSTRPVGLMDVISGSEIPKDSTVYIIEPIGLKEPPYQEIAAADKAKTWIVIYSHEPATERWFDRLILNLTQACSISKNRIILHTSCLQDPGSSLSLIGTIVDYATDIVSCLGKDPYVNAITHHYVCLNRQHKWQRLALIKMLQDQDLDKFGKISYLQSSTPLVLDTPDASWQEQRRIDHPAISGAVVNVITETSYEAEIANGSPTSHYRPCLTEKTFKSMYLCQFPIWVAPQGMVQCFRDLGFDAFDDMIDHGYDTEPNPTVRLTKIVNEVRRVTEIDLDQWAVWRNQNYSRFRCNLDRLQWFSNNHMANLPLWNKAFQVD